MQDSFLSFGLSATRRCFKVKICTRGFFIHLIIWELSRRFSEPCRIRDFSSLTVCGHCCLSFFMKCHTFSLETAGRPVNHIHSMSMKPQLLEHLQNETWLCPAELPTNLFWWQHVSLNQWYLNTVSIDALLCHHRLCFLYFMPTLDDLYYLSHIGRTLV